MKSMIRFPLLLLCVLHAFAGHPAAAVEPAPPAPPAEAAAVQPGQWANPLLSGADPHAVLIQKQEIWIYATGLGPGNGRLYAASSRDLREWTTHGPILDFDSIPWIRADGRREAYAWAPCLARRGRHYYLYYSVGPQSASHPAHIGVAVGDSPAGPFRDSGRALITGGNGFEAIDPMAWYDAKADHWLLYVGGSAGAKLCIYELDRNMTRVARELETETPQHFTEGAFLHYHDGYYHLTYSHGSWRHDSYSVHHATGPSPTGPWAYQGPILTSDERHKGPGHHSICRHPDSGEWLIFYHRWENASGPGPYEGSRQIAADRLVHLPKGRIQPVRMTDAKPPVPSATRP